MSFQEKFGKSTLGLAVALPISILYKLHPSLTLLNFSPGLNTPLQPI